ncbi:MAG: PorV/PorQ family protein [Elusimicrobia bacterium]|nr:PorV/PorQ family protein [Elusimicrobiota bacterium]
MKKLIGKWEVGIGKWFLNFAFTTYYLLLTTYCLYADLPTAQFLLIGQGARAEALGQSVVSNCFNYTAVYWNPAATAFLPRTEIGFNYSQLPAEINSSFLGLVVPYKKCGFGFRYFNEQTDVTAFDSSGAKQSDIQINNTNFNFVFAYKLVESFSVGVGAGITKMDLGEDYSGDGGNFNLGAIYNKSPLSIGMTMANLGGEIIRKDGSGEAEAQPKLIRVGASLSLLKNRNLLLLTSYEKVSDDPDAGGMGFGAEFLPVKYFALRIGAKKQNDETMKPSVGLGLHYDWLSLDYAYTPATAEQDEIEINKIGLSVKFGKVAGEIAEAPVTPAVEPVIAKPLIPKTTIQTNIAVADFGGKNVSAADASIVADFLRTELVNSGVYNVIEKANMDKILAEAAFQQTGCTTSECAVQIGKLLNVKQMVVGSLSKLMDTYYITVNLVDVETSKIIASYDQEAMSAKELRTACKTLAQKLSW